MDDYALKNAITTFLDSAVPDDADVLDRVMSRVATGRPIGKSHRGFVLAVVAAAATLASIGTAFAASGNFPVHLNLIPFVSQGGGVPKEKQPAGGDASSFPRKTEQTSTTMAAAQASFGHHVLTANAASRAQLRSVYFSPGAPVQAGDKPGQPPTPASVSIEYSYAGVSVVVRETFDPSSAPLTVDAIDQGGLRAKTSQGLGPIDIETVAGSPYAVVRTSAGGPIQFLMWKTPEGVVVTLEFNSPVQAATAFDFATGLS